MIVQKLTRLATSRQEPVQTFRQSAEQRSPIKSINMSCHSPIYRWLLEDEKEGKEKSKRLRNYLKYHESFKRDYYLRGNILGHHYLVHLKSASLSLSRVRVRGKIWPVIAKQRSFFLCTLNSMHGKFMLHFTTEFLFKCYSFSKSTKTRV